MDKALRNVIYNTVVQCRRSLERDLALQLEGTYGIHADGAFEPLESLSHLDAVGRADRRAIEAFIHHQELAQSSVKGPVLSNVEGTVGANHRAATERYVRESAFTILNRLAALKLMEHPDRALIQPSVGDGDQSKGFQQFSLLSPEAMRGQPGPSAGPGAGGGYRLFLELLYDDLAQALGALYDRTLPTSILYPTQSCLQEVLDALNAPDLDPVWGEDETIGWIYQYFTPTELRDVARKASSAPRNSYELAFRNQFYTPRYVVAFLVDNTLGRLWWEMRGGETRLAEQCVYLVKRGGAKRAERDPRELRLLDPAVGSAHFLLYCFDLLLVIYDEAYDDPDLGLALREDYSGREDFRRAVPRLIVERNLHGIDIDLRACQIASFALWLRAQRAYAEMGIVARDRPRIARTNIVCAEPMPGEYDLLGEFVRELQPAVLGNMLRDVWKAMELAGEAGSLLKIEREIRDSVHKAREALASLPPSVQLTLFGPEEPQQLPLRLDPRDLDDTAFWADAEARVVEALRAYARQAVREGQVSRRLFADDAMQGQQFPVWLSA